jgi:hypothetical protein
MQRIGLVSWQKSSKLSPHLQLVPELEIIGIILPLPTYAFVACIGKTLTLLANYTPQLMA